MGCCYFALFSFLASNRRRLQIAGLCAVLLCSVQTRSVLHCVAALQLHRCTVLHRIALHFVVSTGCASAWLHR